MTLLTDDPAAYVAEDRRRALAGGPGVDGLVRGSTLFADVSGFTAMTEALVRELGEQRGAEVLAATLEQVFGELIGELHRWGGAVLYFSGDAVTCWLRDDDGTRATRCGFAMQRLMDLVGTVTSPGGATLRLRVKVAVAVGTARRFLAGDPAIQLIDVLAGSLMDEVASAESAAQPGDVVVTRAVLDRLPAGVAVEERATDLEPVTVVAAWPGAAEPDDAAPAADGDAPRLPEAVVREWLLPPVYQRMRAGRGEFLSELRPAVPVFVRFGGLDFETDPTAPQRLDAFVVAVQRAVDGHGGNLLQLTVGDKGAYLYAVFGAPIAHVDDAARACAAALEIAGLQGDVVDVTVGVASGRLRSGTYGHPDRRTFCCLGDAVNLAARLMAKAEPGTVLVSGAVAGAAGDRFRYGDRRKVALKGRARETDAIVVVGERDLAADMAAGGLPPVVGREEEIERVVGALRAAVAHDPGGVGTRMIGVTAEVGAGKSRLAAEALAVLRRSGLRTVVTSAPTRGVAPAYAGWWPVWRSLLDVDPRASASEVADHLSQRLDPGLRPRLPLLGALLGIPLPENDLTATLDAKLRKTSLEQLAVAVLTECAARQPLVLALDDAHALDALSRDLLVEVARVLDDLPVAVLLVYHPGEPLLGLGLERLTTTDEIVLDNLGPDQSRTLAAQSLAELLEGEAPEELVDLVVDRAEGNPLWVRELCRYLHDRAADEHAAPHAVDAAALPDTLQGLVLGRLDLLEETPRRTAKVASVVGRRFAGGLVRRAWPELGAEGDVRRGLQRLQSRGITTAEDLAADLWLFTHGVLRDVAYESLPFALRTTLHDGVAEGLESGDFGDVERHLDDLAHHSWHGQSAERKRHWLRRAGDAAQAGYANETALLHYRRLLTVLPEDEQAEVHVRIGKVLELQTEWEEAASSYERARAAGNPGTVAWATVWAAEVARKRGQYAEAQALLDEAADAFARLGDAAGSAQVGHFAGTLEAQQGHLDAARERYTRSLHARERLGDRAGVASLLSNLAVVAEYEADYDEAGALGERALAVRREIGDRWAIGISQNNLGMLATLRGDPREAQERFAESMALHIEVGDAWMVALGHNNLGNAHRDLGEHERARANYVEALAAYRRFGDEWALAVLYEDVALLLAATGATEDAWRLVGASDALHARIGSPRTPDVTARLEQSLADPGPGSPAGVDELREEGSSMAPADLDRLVAGD